MLLKNIATIFLSLPPSLRISFSLCSGIRIVPLFISIALRIPPLILLAKNDFKVFSISSDSNNLVLSILSTALHNCKLPSCIISFIDITPEASCDVANFLDIFSTKGKNITLSSSGL